MYFRYKTFNHLQVIWVFASKNTQKNTQKTPKKPKTSHQDHFTQKKTQNTQISLQTNLYLPPSKEEGNTPGLGVLENLY